MRPSVGPPSLPGPAALGRLTAGQGGEHRAPADGPWQESADGGGADGGDGAGRARRGPEAAGAGRRERAPDVRRAVPTGAVRPGLGGRERPGGRAARTDRRAADLHPGAARTRRAPAGPGGQCRRPPGTLRGGAPARLVPDAEPTGGGRNGGGARGRGRTLRALRRTAAAGGDPLAAPGLPGGDRPRPAVQGGGCPELVEPTEDRDQRLLDGVGRLPQGDRPADMRDLRLQQDEEPVHGQHVPGPRVPDELGQLGRFGRFGRFGLLSRGRPGIRPTCARLAGHIGHAGHAGLPRRTRRRPFPGRPFHPHPRRTPGPCPNLGPRPGPCPDPAEG